MVSIAIEKIDTWRIKFLKVFINRPRSRSWDLLLPVALKIEIRDFEWRRSFSIPCIRPVYALVGRRVATASGRVPHLGPSMLTESEHSYSAQTSRMAFEISIPLV